MPVGTRLQIEGMRSAIAVLFKRMEATIPDPELTYDEALSLFVPEQHHDILKRASEVAHTGHSPINAFCVPVDGAYWVNGVGPMSDLSLQVGFKAHGGSLPPLIPRYPSWQVHSDISIQEKVLWWAKERARVGRDFGLVRYVFDHLVGTFQTGKQVRYVWPTVLILARNAPLTGYDPRNEVTKVDFRDLCENWAMKHSEFKPVSHPALGMEMREALRKTSAILSAASLLSDDHVEKKKQISRPVVLGLDSVNIGFGKTINLTPY